MGYKTVPMDMRLYAWSHRAAVGEDSDKMRHHDVSEFTPRKKERKQ